MTSTHKSLAKASHMVKLVVKRISEDFSHRETPKSHGSGQEQMIEKEIIRANKKIT